ncbi:MAG: DUF1772 domain-containing protein [Proteobacteria bacterium]|nr:DUF1772 domain-containing protein [Pseudomonadota bacterium]
MRRIALFIALMSTALALGPALAHLLELPNKIALPRNAYFTVQQIYAGWSLLGVVLLVQLLSIASVIAFAGEEHRLRLCAIVALLCLAGAQALFWTFTYPANAATANWTVQPDNWQALRQQWEYSHAAGALLQLVAMASLVVGAIGRARKGID